MFSINGFECSVELGRGGEGVVYLTTDGDVLKVHHAPSNEGCILQNNLPHCPTLLDWEDNWILINKVGTMTLATYLTVKQGKVPMLLPYQLGSAIADLHNAGWVHGDLECKNIMVNDDGSFAGFIDMGCASRTGVRGLDLADLSDSVDDSKFTVRLNKAYQESIND